LVGWKSLASLIVVSVRKARASLKDHLAVGGESDAGLRLEAFAEEILAIEPTLGRRTIG
jgi:hypothetical protein